MKVLIIEDTNPWRRLSPIWSEKQDILPILFLTVTPVLNMLEAVYMMQSYWMSCSPA